jgi:hypothetical protein
MARRKRKTTRRHLSGLGAVDPSFARMAAKTAGTAVVAKLALWAVALLLLKAATKSKSSVLAKVTESAQKIAAPPEFMAKAMVTRSSGGSVSPA